MGSPDTGRVGWGFWRPAVRSMLAFGDGGRIVVVSSISGVRGDPGLPVYGATKAALQAIVQRLAVKYVAHGVTTNATGLAVFLDGPQAGFIIGQVIVADGGQLVA